MVKTLSTMLPLKTKAPNFALPNFNETLSSQTVMSLEQLRSPIATVIMFICNHCPFVKHIQNKLVEVAKKYQANNISFIAINSNDVENFPEDSPENMRKTAKELHFSFPYLFDEEQSIAKAYHAACTPDFFIFDKDLLCVYRGRFDAATPGNQEPITGKDLTDALDAILNNQAVTPDQKASMGCNIKWKM